MDSGRARVREHILRTGPPADSLPRNYQVIGRGGESGHRFQAVLLRTLADQRRWSVGGKAAAAWQCKLSGHSTGRHSNPITTTSTHSLEKCSMSRSNPSETQTGRGRIFRNLKPRSGDEYDNETDTGPLLEPETRNADVARVVQDDDPNDHFDDVRRARELAAVDIVEEFERRSRNRSERILERTRQDERVIQEQHSLSPISTDEEADEDCEAAANVYYGLTYGNAVVGHTFWIDTDPTENRRMVVVRPWIVAICKTITYSRQLPAVMILAQLNYYFRRGRAASRFGSPKLRASLKRNHHLWVAKTREDLAIECFTTPSRVRRALDELLKLKVIVRTHGRFRCIRMMFLRIDWERAQIVAGDNGWRVDDEEMPQFSRTRELDELYKDAVVPSGDP